MNPVDQLQSQQTAFLFFDAYNEVNIEKMLSLFSPDSQIAFIPLGESGKGKVSELGQAIWGMLLESFPDIHNEMIKSRTEENGRLICEVKFTGKQTQDFGEIKNQHKDFDTDHIFVFKFDESGLISEMSVTWDHQDFCRQLGHTL